MNCFSRLKFLFCFLVISFLGYSKAPAVPSYLTEYIPAQHATSLQNNIPDSQNNNLLFLKFRHGIDESSQHFTQHRKNLKTYSDRNNSIYEIAHYFWYQLSVNQKPPRHFDFSLACSLRAPPFC
jgi:hypothetical protein